MKTKLQKAKITKTQALTKLSNIKTKMRKISTKSFFTQFFNAVGKYLYKTLYLDKLDKNTVLLLIFIFRTTLKAGVYTNVIIALFIYLSQILDLEHKFTWELYFYLFYLVYYFFRDLVFDISNRIYSLLRSIMEKFISNLHDVKETVDNKNSITQPAKQAYNSYKEHGTLESLEPSIETRHKVYKIVGAIVAVAAIGGSIYYGYIHFEDVKTFFNGYIAPIPGKFATFVKNLFRRGGGGADGGVADNPVHEFGYQQFELGPGELDPADLNPPSTQAYLTGTGSYTKTTANVKYDHKSFLDYEDVPLNERGKFVNPWFSSNDVSSNSSTSSSSTVKPKID